MVAAGRSASEMNPAFSGACEPYLAALGFLGQMGEAMVVRRRLLAIDPTFSIERYLRDSAYEQVEDREHVARGLRLAGVTEGAVGEAST